MRLYASFSIISPVLEDIIAGIELFNNADFFSAHDFFEELWFESKRDDKLFFQGLVQISVGCYHLICGNYKGASSQLNKGKTKLRSYLPSYKNLDLKKLLTEIELLLLDLNKSFSDSNYKVDISKLPKLIVLL